MGNSLKRLYYGGEPTENKNGSRKRKRDAEQHEDHDKIMHTILNTPKRKCVKSTSKYIYQTLFLDEELSDVTLNCLGRPWKLHKLYLKQSPYFAGMFSGSWKETEMSTIDINIMDDNITQESLKIAFGSLYKDDVFIKPVQITSVVATATLLQLDGLLEQCSMMMTDTLSPMTVVEYHTTSSMYSMQEIQAFTLRWLTRNLLVTQHISFIKDITIELMTEIIASPYLFVMQVEIDLYTLLKKWIYLCNNPSWTGDNANLLKLADAFLQDKLEDGKCYLEMEEGSKYISVFSQIRWHHVINDMSSISILEKDRILPTAWLEPMFLYGWRRVLAIEQGLDKGPPEKLEESVFNESCTRCGRILNKAADYCWRWVGYSYGVDLLVSINNKKLISVRRNTHTQACPQAVSLLDHRSLCYRMTVSSLREDGTEKGSDTTAIKHIKLGKDEEDIALVLDKELEYPLAISMNIVFVTPESETGLPQLKLPDR